MLVVSNLHWKVAQTTNDRKILADHLLVFNVSIDQFSNKELAHVKFYRLCMAIFITGLCISRFFEDASLYPFLCCLETSYCVSACLFLRSFWNTKQPSLSNHIPGP